MDIEKIVLGYRSGNELLLCESDDVYFVYNCKRGELENWFIKLTSRDKITSYEEDEMIRDVAAWRPVDRKKIPCV